MVGLASTLVPTRTYCKVGGREEPYPKILDLERPEFRILRRAGGSVVDQDDTMRVGEEVSEYM